MVPSQRATQPLKPTIQVLFGPLVQTPQVPGQLLLQGAVDQALPFQRSGGVVLLVMTQTLLAALPVTSHSATDSGCGEGVHAVPFQCRITLVALPAASMTRLPTAQTSLAALP